MSRAAGPTLWWETPPKEESSIYIFKSRRHEKDADWTLIRVYQNCTECVGRSYSKPRKSDVPHTRNTLLHAHLGGKMTLTFFLKALCY